MVLVVVVVMEFVFIGMEFFGFFGFVDFGIGINGVE